MQQTKILSIAAFLLVVLAALSVDAGILTRTKYKGSLNHKLLQRDANLFKRTFDVDQWMTQRLDHFDPQNTETFQQRFWVNDTMWQGKNVFIIIGGEGPASSKYLTGHFVINEYGKKHGALLAALEHRFYGESVPRKSLATDNLRYLTSEQALQDLVEFRSLLVKKYRMDEANVKFVCFGGSYSGNLSAWLKAKYPHLVSLD